ncbi:putative CapK protein [Candidatus Burkholderia humilis]|nr:putative CapK protein [Candidatus Burkholderia humilis]
MSLESLKFTLRGIFPDVVRGIPARLFTYPQLKKNEFSLSALQRFTRHAQGGSNPDAAKLVLTDSSPCLTKGDVRANPARFQAAKLEQLPAEYHQDKWHKRPTDDIASGLHGPLAGRGVRVSSTPYRSGDRKAWLRGDIIRPAKKKGQAVTCCDWWTNTLFLSSYHISNDTAASYVTTLAKFDPVLVQAYPSSIYAFVAWMLLHDVRWEGRSLQAIVTSSETLT